MEAGGGDGSSGQSNAADLTASAAVTKTARLQRTSRMLRYEASVVRRGHGGTVEQIWPS